MKNKKYKDLVIATRNRKKKEEIVRLLGGDLNIKIWSLNDFKDVPEIIEDGETFDDNAIKKAKVTAEITGMLSLADDSGIEIDALDKRPGVYSARYAGEEATDRMNNEKLLRELKGVPYKKRTARYRCSVAIVEPDGKTKVVRGECFGIIGTTPKGSTGFGYDPLFIIPRFQKTVAEIGPRAKDKISHRAEAVHKARRVILRHIEKSAR